MHIFEVGLFAKKKDLPYIGASPDAIGTRETFVVECKCPYSIKDERVFDAWNQTEFLRMNSGRACLLVTNTSGNQRNLPEPLKHD